MCRKTLYLISFILVPGSICNAATIRWTGRGADNLWSNPANWQGNTIPTAADEAYVDAPAAEAPDGPVIQDGIDAKASLLACEVAGEPTMTMTGGTLELAGWGMWWGDGSGCHATFNMSGGTIDFTGSPGIFEMAWQDTGDKPGSCQATWNMTGGTVNAKGVDMPGKGNGGYARINLYGGVFNVGTARGGLVMHEYGLIDITEGMLVLEGDERSKVDGLIAAGQITAYDGASDFELDFDIRNPGMTTLTAVSISGNAYRPDPRDGVTDLAPTPTLSWSPGKDAASHNVYFGSNFADVNDGTAFMGNQQETSYGPLDLELGKTYYWRIEEVNTDGTVSEGVVWSFTVAEYIVVDDFEDYNDYPPDRIFETWPGGYAAGDPANGSVVGHLEPPFAEQTFVHSGSQAMVITYDNSGPANLSEAVANIDDLKSGRDWTVRGVKALSLWFRGYPAYVGSFVEGPAGTYTMTAGGYDIGGTSDEFHFAYKEVTGASTVIANVLSVGNTDPWAKAGVMIRDTLDADSTHAMVVVTPNSGVSMQYRSATGGGSESTTQGGITAPQWVKIERTLGGLVRGYYSADGVAWTQLASVSTVAMNTPMYVGLALTSHNENEMCVAQFSNVSFPNTSVEPQWDDRDVGIISNQAEPMYVAISNANGTPAVVYHEDANATLINTWTEWPIDLKKFADKGVNLADVDKMFIGFGTRENPQPGGNGTMYFDDIRLYVPRCVLDKVTPLAGDLTNDCRVDFADLQIMVNDWLQGDYTVPTAVPKDANLVLYYQFENNTVDSSGNAINGTPVGSPGYASGVFGQAIALDGSNYVNCGNPALLNFGRADWSICAWVKNAQADDTATVFANGGDESGGIRYTLGIGEAGPDGAVTITTDDDATKVQAVSTTTVNDNEWHHVCALRNGSELHVYVDGILDATNTVPTGYDLSGASQHNAYVGAITDHRDATGNTLEKFYIGLLDDLRIYDYALSDAELSYLATKGTSGLYFPLVSVANLYDAEPQNAKKVNFKDLAILAGQWLKEQLWPQP